MDKRLTETELEERLRDAGSQIKTGAIYRHYKGSEYKVTGVAITEADSEPCVIYQAIYNDKLTFVRPLSSWLERVETGGKSVQRFSPEQD